MPAITLNATSPGLYALSEAQVSELYDLGSYGKTYDQNQWLCGYVSGAQQPHIAHDIVYGPGYQTGIGSQWQDGHKVGVWPIDLGDASDAALTDQYGCWNFEYPGTVDVVIPIEGFLEHVIKIAVVGPMTDIQGQNQWDGATMAVEEINDAGGVDISGTKYTVELVKVETKEATEGEDGSTGTANLEAVIDNVDFVLGGFRTEVVSVYREVVMDAQKIFMNCGAATGSLQFSVVTNYPKYKYWFKATPYNESFLVKSCLKITGTVGTVLRQTLEGYGDAVAEDYRVPGDGKLRVHIVMEDAAWCAGMVGAAQYNLPLIGYTVTGTTLVSPTASDISSELSQIAAAKPHIIFTGLSGSVAAVYSIQKNSLGIPAMTIGINVPGEHLSHWVNTDGKCLGEIMLDTWGVGMENTALTAAWFADYVSRTGRYPVYTAGTYDAIHVVCKAIDDTNSLDSDTLVTWLEDPAHAMTEGVSSPKVGFYPMPAIEVTLGQTYALSEAQVAEWYDLASYNKTYDQNQWLCGYVSGVLKPHIAHDLVYGPGLVTGIGSQWQTIEGAGAKVGIWPMDLGPAYDAALTDQYGCWNFEYPGTTDVLIPIEGFLAS
jgi:branched-chain amino acid transport system substrate-binding protein